MRAPVLGELVRHTAGILLGRRFVRENVRWAFSPDPVPEDYQKLAQSRWTRPGQLKAIAEDNIAISPALRRRSTRYDDL